MNTELLIPNIKNSFICVHNIENAIADSEYDWHIHEEFEMYLCLSGKKTFYTPDKEYTLGTNDIFLVNRMVPHRTKTYKGCKGFLLQFRPTNEYDDIYRYLTYFINNSNLDAYVFTSSNAISTELKICLSSIIKENTNKQKAFGDFVKAEIYKIFAILYRYDIVINPEYFFTTNEINKIFPALDYIDKHYKEKISLSTIRRLLNFDKSYFCRIFKKTVGVSFVAYINFVRISKAEKLLFTTEKTVSDIAEAVGFSSSAYFTETFKKYKFCTPSQYRKYKLPL